MLFPIQKQKEDKWCWAAVSASVDNYFSPTPALQQCTVAHDVLPALDCCVNPDVCNTGASLELALAKVGRFKKMLLGPAKFTDICAQLNLNLPVGARIAWNQGGAHFVVIAGFSVSPSGEQVLSIADPLFWNSTIYYKDFVSAYQAKTNGGGKWTHTYYVRP
jgi:hypothetical protein